MTLRSAVFFQKHCRAAALNLFKEGLQHANVTCSDKGQRIHVTLYNLDTCCQKIQCSPDVSIIAVCQIFLFKCLNENATCNTKPSLSSQTQTDTAACKWENEGSRKPFAGFVKDFQDFINILKSGATAKTAKKGI